MYRFYEIVWGALFVTTLSTLVSLGVHQYLNARESSNIEHDIADLKSKIEHFQLGERLRRDRSSVGAHDDLYLSELQKRNQALEVEIQGLERQSALLTRLRELEQQEKEAVRAATKKESEQAESK